MPPGPDPMPGARWLGVTPVESPQRQGGLLRLGAPIHLPCTRTWRLEGWSLEHGAKAPSYCSRHLTGKPLLRVGADRSLSLHDRSLAFSRSSCEGNCTESTFGVWLLALAVMILRFLCVVALSVLCSFLLPRCVLLKAYTTFCLSTSLWVTMSLVWGYSE